MDEIVKSFAKIKPMRLMCQDEARFGRISDTRYCWARRPMRPMRPMVKAMLTYQYTYAYGAVCPVDGKFDSLVLPLVNTECMQLLITEIGKRYPEENIVMVVDGAGWHKSKTFALPEKLAAAFLAALLARAQATGAHLG